MLKQIKNVTKGSIEKKAIPTVNDILNVKSQNILKDVTDTINESDYSKFIPVAKDLVEQFDSVDVIAALIKSTFY